MQKVHSDLIKREICKRPQLVIYLCDRLIVLNGNFRPGEICWFCIVARQQEVYDLIHFKNNSLNADMIYLSEN